MTRPRAKRQVAQHGLQRCGLPAINPASHSASSTTDSTERKAIMNKQTQNNELRKAIMNKQTQNNELTKWHSGVLFLLLGILLGIGASALAQTQMSMMKPNLKVQAPAQGNCLPLTFQVTNSGAVDAGAFEITVSNKAGKVVQTFSVPGLKAKETRAFSYPQHLYEVYTVFADSGSAVGELSEKDNSIKVMTSCIK
jgi:hypothetical protein